ncbi:MAG TPA: hypothetical protein VMJ31_03485 [Methylocystis sp.]|nr:hypothetical protein [Methylocystis sp.]
MDPLTLFLGKLIGATFIVFAGVIALRGKTILETARRMIDDPGMLMLSGALRTIAGLAIVLGHDIWSGGFLPVAVTVFGWALFFSGLLLLFATPERMVRMFAGMKLESRLGAYAGGLGVVGLAYLLGGYIG